MLQLAKYEGTEVFVIRTKHQEEEQVSILQRETNTRRNVLLYSVFNPA